MYRIFNVDDEIGGITLLGLMLRRAGFEFFYTQWSDKAFEMIKETDPHLIILDTMMPGIHGFELCQQLKASVETKPIPIIFLTTQIDADSVVRGMEMGAVDYLPKPILHHEIAAIVRRILQDSPDLEPFFSLKQQWNDCAETERTATFTPMLDDSNIDPVCREYLVAKLEK